METWIVQPEQVSFGDSPCLSFPLATETRAKSAGQAPLPFIRGKINLSLMCFGFQSKSGHREFCSWCWPWNGTRGCPWAHLGLGSWKASRSRRVNYSHPSLLCFHLSYPASPCSFWLRDLSVPVSFPIKSKSEFWDPTRAVLGGIQIKEFKSPWFHRCPGLLL